MEKEVNQNILKNIGIVFEKSKGCKLEPNFFREIDSELCMLSSYFKTSKTQALFIVMIFTLSYKARDIGMQELLDHFECNPVRLLEYNDDIEALYEKRIFTKKRPRLRFESESMQDVLQIDQQFARAIIKRKPVPDMGNLNCENVADLLEKVYDYGAQRNNDEISTDELFLRTQEILNINNHFPLIKKVLGYELQTQDLFFFLYLIWKALTGYETVYIDQATDGIFDRGADKVSFIQKFLAGQNDLVKRDLIETVESEFVNDDEVKLSNNALKILNDCGLKLLTNRKKRDNVILPSKIPARKLIYEESEKKQVGLLKDLLQEDNLIKTQSRLAERNMPKGITILLHGLPGTGKTETVLQLAKGCGREIMKVEISKSKSMWYGKSEKLIKQIFTEYKFFAEECKHTPILLFNEADAIISMRRELNSSNISQTENTIQNIILEELETFEGILFATTNLVKNIDPAFDRRFLFKVKFEKPGISSKAKIWKLKLPRLSIPDCETLATQFDFSGGQIDNIARKKEISEIINGEKVDFEKIIEFCEEEVLVGKTMRIGF